MGNNHASRKYRFDKTDLLHNDAPSMNNIRNVFRFGGVYLRRYWRRLAAGIRLVALFGVSNTSFVWATRVLTSRLVPDSAAPTLAARAAAVASPLTKRLTPVREEMDRLLDAWLPKQGCSLDSKMV